METRDSEDKVQSVAEYAPEIIDQLFHDEGLYMPRVNYMVPRIASVKPAVVWNKFLVWWSEREV